MSSTSFAGQIDQLHEQAARLMGSDDFGDEKGYRSNLQFMLACADKVSNWTEFGRMAFPHKVIGMLCSRLSAQQGFAQFPDYRQQPVDKPIIVVGFRSGTTALHKLLSSTPDTQTLEFWTAMFPRPRPPRNTWQSNPFFDKAQKSLDQLYEMYPYLRAIHFMSADEADESHRADYSFGNPGMQALFWEPGFFDWTLEKDQRDAYAQFKKVIQLIGYGNNGKWVLKCPLHMLWIEHTLEQFPTATIVNTYRDPLETIPSVCNTIYNFIAPFQSFDKKAFGPLILDHWAPLLERYMASRERLSADRFLDVDYRDIVADPLGTVKRVYLHCDGEFDADKEAKVLAWHKDNKKGKHGENVYSGEEYGLPRGMIRERTAKYREFYSMRA